LEPKEHEVPRAYGLLEKLRVLVQGKESFAAENIQPAGHKAKMSSLEISSDILNAPRLFFSAAY